MTLPLAGRCEPGRPVQAWWYGLMASGGSAFGWRGDRRPFGGDVLAHPFVIYFGVVAAGLLVLRVVGARPVPPFLPNARSGNWVATRLP